MPPAPVRDLISRRDVIGGAWKRMATFKIAAAPFSGEKYLDRTLASIAVGLV
jgi:hypothetical protein